MKIINKVIILLFVRIIKKNKFIKTEIINHLNNYYFEELKTVVHSKENEEKKKNYKYEEKKNNFINVKAGDVVIAKKINIGQNEEDNPHLYRPFFVVGRSRKKIFGLYCTSKPYFSKKYVKCDLNKTTYLDCSKIFTLSFDDFKYPAESVISDKDAKIILKNMLNYSHNYNNIDFKAFFKKVTCNSIVRFKNRLYKISGIDVGGYEAYPLELAEEYNNVDKYVVVMSKKYRINEKKKVILDASQIVVISDTTDYHVYENDKDLNAKNTIDKIGDKKVKSYRYGDVLSIKNSKNKIIYITEGIKEVYYVTYDALDFFKGISKISKVEISAHYDRLDENELNRLTLKLSKAVEKQNLGFVSDETKKEISKLILTRK